MSVLRLLLVDDDDGVRLVTRVSLERAVGIHVDEAASITEARELLRSHRYRVILVDVRLRGESGWDLIDWMRTSPGCTTIPVILFSADAPDVGASTEPATQVRGVIHKPFDPDVLPAAVMAILGEEPDPGDTGGSRIDTTEGAWLGDLWGRHRESLLDDLGVIAESIRQWDVQRSGHVGLSTGPDAEPVPALAPTRAVAAAHRLHGALGVYGRRTESDMAGRLYSMLRSSHQGVDAADCAALVRTLRDRLTQPDADGE